MAADPLSVFDLDAAILAHLGGPSGSSGEAVTRLVLDEIPPSEYRATLALLLPDRVQRVIRNDRNSAIREAGTRLRVVRAASSSTQSEPVIIPVRVLERRITVPGYGNPQIGELGLKQVEIVIEGYERRERAQSLMKDRWKEVRSEMKRHNVVSVRTLPNAEDLVTDILTAEVELGLAD